MVNFETLQIGLLWTLTQCQRSLEPDVRQKQSTLGGWNCENKFLANFRSAHPLCFHKKTCKNFAKTSINRRKQPSWLTSPDHPDPIYTAIDASSLSNSSVFSAGCDPRAACRRKSAANLLSDNKFAWRKLQMKLNLNASPSTFLWTFTFDPNPSWFDLAGRRCDCITVAPAAATQRKPKIWQETYNGRVPQ